jgi:hypothetical protein
VIISRFSAEEQRLHPLQQERLRQATPCARFLALSLIEGRSASTPLTLSGASMPTATRSAGLLEDAARRHRRRARGSVPARSRRGPRTSAASAAASCPIRAA